MSGYGIWDGEGWLGTTRGPNVYKDELIARAAMTILFTQLIRTP